MAVIRDDLLREFAICSSVLVLKILAMALLTGRQRFVKKVVISPEDAFTKSTKVSTTDEDVERVRRAHRNDLENILPWFVMTLIWLTTGPSYYFAMFLMRTFVVARIIHTIVYAIIPMQPHRAIAFFVGYGITGYQAFSTLINYM
uniref:Microsomal glutathione S-transferase 1 n=1 Tax=Meteorus pulchricornis TaxID=51522 RepID=A0A6M3GU77_9HYME|nr:glutathione S transferase microsomal 1 [Meteorus pulchricornis]